MATLSNLLGGGSAGAIDHRKEGLPLFGLFGTSGDQNDHMTYRIFDSGFKIVGSPWGAVCNSTTNYRFGVYKDLPLEQVDKYYKLKVLVRILYGQTQLP